MSDAVTVVEALPDEVFYENLERARRFAERTYAVRPWGSWVIMATCAIVFAFEVKFGQHSSTYLRMGAIAAPLVHQGEWWRLVGAMFVHLGVAHFAVNMYSLYAIGPPLERMYGTLRFLVIYALSGVISSMVALKIPLALSAGASGALFGIVGAALSLGYFYRNYLPAEFGRRLRKVMLTVVVFNLALGFGVNAALQAYYHSSTMVGNSIHVAGLIAGLIVGALLRPQAVDGGRPLEPAAALLLVVLAATPFVVESGVIAHAVRSAVVPTQPYQDGLAGYAFDYPADLLRVDDPNGHHFVGDDYTMLVQTAQSAHTVPQEVMRYRHSDLEVRSTENSTVAGRAWTVIRAHDAVHGEDILIALTEVRGAVVRVEAGTESGSSLDEANKALRSAMQTFRTF